MARNSVVVEGMAGAEWSDVRGERKGLVGKVVGAEEKVSDGDDDIDDDIAAAVALEDAPDIVGNDDIAAAADMGLDVGVDIGEEEDESLEEDIDSDSDVDVDVEVEVDADGWCDGRRVAGGEHSDVQVSVDTAELVVDTAAVVVAAADTAVDGIDVVAVDGIDVVDD